MRGKNLKMIGVNNFFFYILFITFTKIAITFKNYLFKQKKLRSYKITFSKLQLHCK